MEWNFTWSLRLRAVWSFLAGSPTRSIRAASTFMCTSSLSALHSNFPDSMRFSISSSPLTIASRSSSLIIPCIKSLTQLDSWKYSSLILQIKQPHPFISYKLLLLLLEGQRERQRQRQKETDLFRKHVGMCTASHEIMLIQLPIIRHRLTKPFHSWCHTLLKPSTPQFRLLLLQHQINLSRCCCCCCSSSSTFARPNYSSPYIIPIPTNLHVHFFPSTKPPKPHSQPTSFAQFTCRRSSSDSNNSGTRTQSKALHRHSLAGYESSPPPLFAPKAKLIHLKSFLNPKPWNLCQP